MAVAGLMVGSGAAGALVAGAVDDDESAAVPTSLSADRASTPAPAEEAPDEPLSQVAADVLPSVVSITVDSEAGAGQGSGVVISEDGMILTNNHVVSSVPDSELSVTTSDGETTSAEVVGTDPTTDLAVIDADADGLTPATLGSSADLNVGDTVLAIGSPLGLDGSVTSGIVSALNRAITLPASGGQPGEDEGASVAVIDAIQTDAAINPGNSGGALINADGEVVGINTAIASTAGGGFGSQGGNIGVGFAIPIDAAADIADQLIDGGEVSHAYLGVRIGDAEDRGALVGGVEANSPADEAGLERGDVITAVDGDPVHDAAHLTAAVRSHKPGDRITLTLERDGDERDADVRLGALPD